MKIGHLENKPAVTPAGTERKGAAGDASGTTATEPSAKVELSAAALLGPEGATPEFDAEKVQRIAQAIRDGKFQVNADAIADKLISNAQEVLSRSSH
jgi:negative regulator of flagellin synthesis FlgM